MKISLFGVQALKIQKELGLEVDLCKRVDVPLYFKYRSIEGRGKIEVKFDFEGGECNMKYENLKEKLRTVYQESELLTSEMMNDLNIALWKAEQYDNEEVKHE